MKTLAETLTFIPNLHLAMFTAYSSNLLPKVKAFLIIALLWLPSHNILAQTAINYPIEVFRILNDAGTAWDTLSNTITVNTKAFTGAAPFLYLKVNNLNKASALSYRLRVDGGNWSSWQIADPNFDEFPKDEAYGGLGGGFGTNEFATPISGFEPNREHQIQFSFNYEAPDEESGYRILDIKLWQTNDVKTDNQLTNGRIDSDPSTWQGPFGNGATQEAAEGEDLWFGRNGAPSLKDASGALIKASCSDCHAQSGYDLKYFNYSNKSIESRATFHGLSREEAKKIAQYIRDLGMKNSENGRPWQPPYQPGPDADKDAFEWAAGAGLENVIPNEDGLLQDMFGSTNPSKTEIRDAVNAYEGNTNIRTQRIATQFPDWNEWLPRVHPKDILSDADYNVIETAFANLKNSVDTEAERDNLNSKTGVWTIYANNGLFEALGIFATEVHKVIAGDYSFNFPRSPEWADNISTQSVEDMKKSLSHWYSVKLFDVIHEYDLHDIDDLGNIPNSEEEVYQWPTREWAVFQNAAHVISGNRVTAYMLSDVGNATKETKSIYLSSLWYQVQLTLTPGHRRGGVVVPNDYSYNLQHIHRLEARTGIAEPVRFFQNYLKAAEQRNNGLTPGVTSGVTGWNMRELSPWRLWSTGRGNTDVFDALPTSLKRDLRDVFMDETADILLSFSEDDWDRTTVTQCPRTDFELESRNTTPINGTDYQDGLPNCIFYDRRCAGGCEDANDAVEIDAIYSLLEILDDNGEITEATFNKLRSWADARWDFTDWPIYDVSTSLEDDKLLTMKSNLSLYPNPVSEILNINGLSYEIKQLKFIDMLGRVYLFDQTNGEVNISELPSGLYVVKVEDALFTIIKE